MAAVRQARVPKDHEVTARFDLSMPRPDAALGAEALDELAAPDRKCIAALGHAPSTALVSLGQ